MKVALPPGKEFLLNCNISLKGVSLEHAVGIIGDKIIVVKQEQFDTEEERHEVVERQNKRELEGDPAVPNKKKIKKEPLCD